MLICIDSNIFIWGIKKQCSLGQEKMLSHAEAFFKWVEDEKHDLLLPSLVLAECLQPEPIEKHNEYIQLAYNIFQIKSFGIVEALKYGELLNESKFSDAKQLTIELCTNREKMKIDHLILACALANGAKKLFTTDDRFAKFAQKLIVVDTITSIPVQSKIEF